MRSEHELESAEKDLAERLWYERHLVLMGRVKTGEAQPGPWLEGSERAAEDVRRRHGDENLGPYSEFEWGMLNGKLSALRWMLGGDWDELHS